MQITLWIAAVLGFLATFPEVLRVYRKYGLVLAIAVWPALAAVIALWAFLTIEFYRESHTATNNLFFTVYHLLFVVVAPAIVTISITRRYNFSAGLLAGGSLLTVTALFFFAMALGAGGL